MSASLLSWFDQHPTAYLVIVGVALAVATVVAVRPLWRGEPDAAPQPDWAWALPILGILFLGRWPALIFPRELSVDESQLLAGAHALAHDPVFWRSVNGGTAGPLDFYALWPAGWVFGWDSYLTARVTALLLLATTLLLVHQVLARVTGRTIARAASLAALALEALTHATDFQHYSTELVPMSLIAGAVYAATRRWSGGGIGWGALGGLLLGAVPFAKLQPVPLAAAGGLAWLWVELRTDTRRPAAALVVGATIPAAIFASMLTVAGEWPTFWESYVVFNFQYASAGGESTGQTLVGMLSQAWRWDPLLVGAGAAGAVWLALLIRLRGIAARPLRVLTWAAFGGCALALVCIVSPKRAYLHYWQLLVVPGTLLLGALIARVLASAEPSRARGENRLAAALTVAFTILLLGNRAAYPNLFVGELASFQAQPHPALALRVRALAHPGETLAVWGRADRLYVETGLRQATRESHTAQGIEPGPGRARFRERYLADFNQSKPTWFIDVVGPQSAQFKDPALAHDRTFPELAGVVRAEYRLVEEFEQARIYQRLDSVAR